MKINISGGMHVGKTTLADGLVKAFPFTRIVSFATPLRRIASTLGLPHTRTVLQTIGHGMRELDEDVWLNLWLRECAEYDGWNIISDDARYQNEVDAADYIIRLNANVETQWIRYQTSTKFDPAISKGAWMSGLSHATETAELDFPDDKTLHLFTDTINAADVLMDVRNWLSPRLEQHWSKVESPATMRMKAIYGSV